MWGADWSKNFYEEPRDEIVAIVAKCGSTVLSIGCGSGATELRLTQQGQKVTAIPLDSVIGATAARHGFEVIPGNGTDAFAQLDGRTFDCVLLTNLLHLQRDPLQLLTAGAKHLAPGGSLVTSGPNFSFVQPLLRRWRKRGDYKYMRSFSQSGIQPWGRAGYERLCRRAGLRIAEATWLRSPTPSSHVRRLRDRFPRFLAPAWLIHATR
jgi:SAM-dependent methyltransferase